VIDIDSREKGRKPPAADVRLPNYRERLRYVNSRKIWRIGMDWQTEPHSACNI